MWLGLLAEAVGDFFFVSFLFFNFGILDAQFPAEMHFSLITTIPGGLPHAHQALRGWLIAEGKKHIIMATNYPLYNSLCPHNENDAWRVINYSSNSDCLKNNHRILFGHIIFPILRIFPFLKLSPNLTLEALFNWILCDGKASISALSNMTATSNMWKTQLKSLKMLAEVQSIKLF